MPAPCRAPSTLGLLTAAFVTILLTLLAAGALIDHEGGQVRRETRAIMENGLPSIVAATRMRDVLPELRLAEQECERDESGSRTSFARGVRRFSAILAREDRAVLEFTGERSYRQDIHRRLDRLAQEDSALRASLAASDRARIVGLERRVTADLAGLEAACVQFERLNQRGMRAAQQVLDTGSAREQSYVDAALAVLAVLGVAWAVLLARAIATPLAQLKQDVRALPDASAGAKVSMVSWTPHELRDLVLAFEETAQLLRRTAEQRERAQGDLQASLQREHLLNAELAGINERLDEQVRVKTAALESANAKLSELIAQLQLRDRSKSAFLASVSHELRTPLAVIKGAALTLLNLEAQLETEARRVLASHIEEEAEHLAGLVEDLLDVARMEAGTFRISPEPAIQLLPLVESVVGSLSTLFANHPIKLCVSHEELPPLTADPERIRQVLRNLLENAVKFSTRGAVVELHIQRLGADEDPERLEVCVHDSGRGVSAELSARLFLPFSRGETTESGTGLGLAIARQLVEAHGGRIGLRPSPLGGSAFWFWLPTAASYSVT